MRRAAFVLAFGAVALLAAAPGAHAHALLVSSEPEQGTQLDAAPNVVTIVFSEEPELAFSSIRVLDESGTPVDRANTEVVPDEQLALRVGVGDLGRGVYTVAWRVISKVDGHATGGAFAFGVGVDPATAPLAEIPLGTEEPAPSPLEIAARWCLYLGLGLLLGVVMVGAVAFTLHGRPFVPERVWRLGLIGWATSVVGWVLLAEAQRRPTGAGFGDLLGTGIGRALMWRAVAIAAAGGLFLAGHRMHGTGGRVRPVLVLVAVATTAAILVHASAGHAGTGDLLWVKVIGQAVHIAAVGLWLGGLAALLVGLRETETMAVSISSAWGKERAEEHLWEVRLLRPRAVRRFSAAAGVMLVIVVLTGALRTLNELPGFSALWESWYGRVVLIKVGLIAGIAALGGVNRYRNVPRAEQDVAGLRRFSGAELVLAALTLVAAGSLATLSPPIAGAEARAVTRGPISLEGSDFATTTRATLEIDPGFAGPNTFTVRLADFDSNAPVEGASVRLLFRYLDDAIGQTELVLEDAGEGTYGAGGSEMGLDGRWRITVLVQQEARSVEIALQTATRCRVQPIPVPDGPTLYDVQLAGGRTGQGYVDPGDAGFNEVHITYFDEQGTELDVDGEPRFTATPRGGGPEDLVVRRFGPGHFIGDAQLEPGPYRFDVTAVIGGERISTCFEETILG